MNIGITDSGINYNDSKKLIILHCMAILYGIISISKIINVLEIEDCNSKKLYSWQNVKLSFWFDKIFIDQFRVSISDCQSPSFWFDKNFLD